MELKTGLQAETITDDFMILEPYFCNQITQRGEEGREEEKTENKNSFRWCICTSQIQCLTNLFFSGVNLLPQLLWISSIGNYKISLFLLQLIHQS